MCVFWLPPWLTSMRLSHWGKRAPSCGAGEYCRERRGKRRNIHPRKHAPQLLWRHYSGSLKACTESAPVPSPTLASLSSSTHPAHTRTQSSLPPPLFCMSQKALSICCRMLQITSVCVHVFESVEKRAQKVVRFMHLLCQTRIQTHAHTQTNTLLHTPWPNFFNNLLLNPLKILSSTWLGNNPWRLFTGH